MTDNGQRNRRSERYQANGVPPAHSLSSPKGAKKPRQALGRSEELRAREAALREERQRMAEPFYSREAAWASGQQHYDVQWQMQKKQHRGFWFCLILICGVCLVTLGLLVAPQLLGIRFSAVPNYAFVNGSVIAYDDGLYQQYRQARQQMAAGTFFPGVSIDGVDLGGKTMDEARVLLSGVEASGGGSFSISVTVDDNTWVIDSNQVPMTRNTEEMLAKAWAIGRNNTGSIRETRMTPFQQRVNAAAQLSIEPVAFATALTYDREHIRALTDEIARRVNIEPVDASVAGFDVGSRTFSFNADLSGQYVDPDALHAQVMSRLETGDWWGSVNLHTETRLANVTKAELMSSFRKISAFSTKTTDNKNRNTNIRLSADAINGMVVQPGETFSFNAATGERTSQKGYLPAAAIAGGQVNDEVGGGVCQTSSTLFNAVARANLEIVSRSPHAWPSTYVPEGMDATVNWPNLDFKWKNTTKYPIYIISWYENKKVTVELYGMGLGDGVTIDLEHERTKIVSAPDEVKEVRNASLPAGTRKKTVSRRDGSVWVTYRVWYQFGEEIKREELCKSTYKTYQETIEWN